MQLAKLDNQHGMEGETMSVNIDLLKSLDSLENN